VGKPERRRPLGRPRRHRWVDDIKMNLREIGWDPSDIGQGPVEDSCEHGNETSGCEVLE
jgi:hypothetical protein